MQYYIGIIGMHLAEKGIADPWDPAAVPVFVCILDERLIRKVRTYIVFKFWDEHLDQE